MKVSIIALADRAERLPVLVWSLFVQTHTDWELLILDQSETKHATKYVGPALCAAAPRRCDVHFVDRVGDWGQTVKEDAARHWATGDVLLFPNDDAYYVPTALADMVSAIEHGADVALCGWLYDLMGYAAMPPDPHVGRVDVGGFLVKRDLFVKVGWPSKVQTGDGLFIESLVQSGALIAGCHGHLYVKN